MADEKRIEIIGNESNTVHIVEAEGTPNTPGVETTAEKVDAASQQETYRPFGASDQRTNELATNDGAVSETFDTAFHNKPGVAEGSNPSGSDRADYYETHASGKSDAEEETDALKTK